MKKKKKKLRAQKKKKKKSWHCTNVLFFPLFKHYSSSFILLLELIALQWEGGQGVQAVVYKSYVACFYSFRW